MGLVLQPTTSKDRVEAGPGFYATEAVPESGFAAATKASFVDENSVAQWYSDLNYQSEADAVDGYDQYQDIPQDLEELPLDTWLGVTSPAAMQNRIHEVRAERQRHAIAATNGWGSFVGGMAGYMLSPETIPELFLTQGRSGLAGAIRVGLGAMAFTTAHEAVMHEESYTRDWQQSMVNIGLATFAGAGIGSVLGTQAKRQFLKDLTKDLQDIASPSALKPYDPDAQSIGAAMEATSGELIADKPWLKWKWLGPIRPIMHSRSKVAAQKANNLMEHGYMPEKVKAGQAKQVSLETRVNREVAILTKKTYKAMNGGYKAWLKEHGIGGVGRLRGIRNWHAFQRDLHMALVSGDKAESKAIMETAKAIRSQYDEIYRIAKKAREVTGDESVIGLEDFTARFADSYAPRRYNKARIRKDQIAFKQALRDAFKAERERQAFEASEAPGKTLDDFRITDPETLSEIDGQVNDSYDRIVHSYDLDVYMPFANNRSGSPFKERKIPLRDEVMIDRGWLDSDVQSMTMNYVNKVLKPSRMLLEEGDTELKSALKSINDHYEVLRADAAKVGDEKLVRQIENEQIAVRDSFEAWRDRWYGRSTIASSRSGEAVNDALRTVRNLNVARMMGMVTLVSAGDVTRANLTTIFAPELGKRGPGLLAAIRTARLSKKEFERIGIAHETAMHVRTGKILDDSGFLEGSSKMVNWSGATSRGLMRISGLAHWTDWMKELAAAYTQNDIVQKMRGFAKLSPKSRAALAQLGIDENMAKRLQREVASSKGREQAAQSVIPLGKDTTGYEGIGYVLRFENFEDRELADRLANVMFRESERNIVTPAAGDIPNLFANDQINRTVFQFQSFLFSAATSITPAIARRFRSGDPKAALILTNMMLGGMFAVALRKAAYGDLDELGDWSPQDWAINAFDYSTVAPLMMMAFNQVNMFTGNGLVNALGAESMVRFQHRPLGSVFGPSVGTAEDLLVAAQSLAGVPFGDNLSPTDIRRIRRLLPWNNLAYVSAAVTAAQEAAEEAVQ